MRTLSKNKQKLWYSVQGVISDGYARDSDGNIIYEEIDGQKIPRRSGQKKVGYLTPVEFIGNIHNSGGEAQSMVYGISTDGYDAVLYASKDELPITETSLIWYQHEPTYNTDGTVNQKSADYIVKRVPPALNETVYLLSRVSE